MNRISVIVPIYYGENYIRSIIDQLDDCKIHLNRKDRIELLLVNDAPDAPISDGWSGANIDVIILNTEENVGIHGARLKGLLRCHGEYILFLDQDDRIHPNYFYSQLQAMGDQDGVVCRAIENGKLYYTEDYIFEEMITNDFILGEWNSILSPGQVLLRRASIPTEWMENVLKNNGADDWFLWLCMIAKGCSFSLNQDVLYEHVKHYKNASDNLVSMLRSEQEVIGIIREKKILKNEDKQLLLHGFLEKYTIRMGELYEEIKRKRYHDQLLENWMTLRDMESDFSMFFKKYGYKKIAIYGAGKFGTHLYNELKNSDIEISFGIDQNSENITYPVPVYSPCQQMPSVDAIVITIIDQYEEIRKMLEEKQSCAMIPLQAIIRELMTG